MPPFCPPYKPSTGALRSAARSSGCVGASTDAGPTQSPVPGHTGLDVFALPAIQPGDAATPAKTGDANLFQVAAVSTRPFDRAVQVSHDLCIRHFGHHLGDQFDHFAVLAGIPLTCIQLGCNRQIAGFGKTPPSVGNVLMHAKNFLNHQNHRRVFSAIWRGIKNRYRETLHVVTRLARSQTVAGSLDGRLRHDRHRRGRVTHTKRQFQCGAAAGTLHSRLAWQQGVKVFRLILIEQEGSSWFKRSTA